MKRELKYILGIFSFIFIIGTLGIINAEIISCYSNSDCVSGFIGSEFCSNNDIYKNFLNSSCINPGTNTSYCSNNSIPTFLIDCGTSDYDSWSSNYCINNSVYHSRTGTERGCRIINPISNISGCFSEFVIQEVIVQTCTSGCSNGNCNNNTVVTCHNNSECGFNGFFGNLSCSNNDVFQNFITYTCNNPGTTSSSCSNTINSQLKQDCGDNSCGSYGTNYCRNNNIYHNRTCTNRGCNLGACSNSSYSDETLIETCHHGCENGICIHMPNMTCMNNSECNDNNNFTEDLCINPGTLNSSCVHNPIRCFNDLQCGVNGFNINKYCKNDDVYSDYNTYKCLNHGTINSSCSVNTTSRLFERCDNKCQNGECREKNPIDYPNYEDNYSEPMTSPIITGYDVYIANQTFDDSVKITAPIKSESGSELSLILGKNLFILLLIFIIILIVLIIILSLRR